MNQQGKNRFTLANDNISIKEEAPDENIKTAGKFRIEQIKGDQKKSISIIIVISAAVIAIAVILVIINTYNKPLFYTPSKENNILSFSGKKEIPVIQSSNEKLQKGRESYSKGYLNNAISYFNEVIESDASNTDKATALTYIGIIHDDRNNYNKAVEYYQRALKYDNKNIITYRNLAITYRHLNDHKSAEKTMKKGLNIDPDNVQNRILMGNILYEQGNFKEAAAEYEDAIKLNPEPAALHNLALALLNTGKESLAMEYLMKAGASDNKGAVAEQSYSKLGVMYIERKDFDSAEKYLRMAEAINQREPVIKYNLGVVYLKTKQPEKAIEEFLKAEALGHNDENLMENLGESYFSLNDYEKSIATFNKILNNNRRNVKILSKLAEIYYQKGDTGKAYELYQNITTIEPGSENARIAYINMGNILDDTGRYDEAIEIYGKALTINSDDDSALYNLGIAYKNAGKPELAVKSWSKASELNTESPKPLIAIASMYEEKGLYDLAIESYQKISKRWENLQEAHFNLAMLYCRKNLSDYAKEEFKRTIEINSNNELSAKAYTNLGILVTKNAGNNEIQLEQAEGYIQKALLQNPNDAEALISLGKIYLIKGLIEKAIDTFNLAISSTRDNKLIAEAYNNIGKCYHREGQYQNALKAFTRGLEEDPTLEEIRINRKISMQAYEDTLRR